MCTACVYSVCVPSGAEGFTTQEDQELLSRIEKQIKRRFVIGSQVSEYAIVQDFLKQVPPCRPSLSLTQSLAVTHSVPRCHSLSPSLSLTQSLAVTHSVPRCHSLCPSLSLTLSLDVTHSVPRSHSLCPSLSLTQSLSQSHKVSLTYLQSTFIVTRSQSQKLLLARTSPPLTVRASWSRFYEIDLADS